MSKKAIFLILTLAGLANAASAQAQPGRGNPLAGLDSDGDGNISFAEFQQADSPMLTRLDTDADERLSLDEFLAAREGRGPRNPDREVNAERREQLEERRQDQIHARFQEMDLDGDGFVSRDELQEANFVRMDRDNDNLLSADELRPPKHRGVRPGGPRGGRGGQRQGQSAQD